MIYCVGDSHASVFTGLGERGKDYMTPIYPQQGKNELPGFKAFNIGPATAYQLGRKKDIIMELLRKEAPSNATVLFCFGEVDIRAHLIKQQTIRKISMSDIVRECVDRYTESLFPFQDQGYDIWVWGPIASNPEELPYKGLQGAGPIYGDCVERNQVTRLFNNMMAENCHARSIGFVSIFEKMVWLDDNTKEHLIMDHLHLSQTSMSLIKEEFKKKGLL